MPHRYDHIAPVPVEQAIKELKAAMVEVDASNLRSAELHLQLHEEDKKLDTRQKIWEEKKHQLYISALKSPTT